MGKRFLTVLGAGFMAVLLAFGAAAQDSDIRGTIDSQIDAFRADDFATAFTFATPTLQRLFQTPENFQRMVTQGYPMVWRPSGVRYLDQRQEGEAIWQMVEITDADGVAHFLDYKMEQTDEGWRIGAVIKVQPPGAAV